MRLLLGSVCLGTVVFATAIPPGPNVDFTNPRQPHAECSWPGWSKIKYMVVFGDSYTTTGFSTTGLQPSASNPFGNPAYPGYTSSNGPNWIDALATKYNRSLVEVVNLAYGGATVDSSLVTPYETTVLSLREQVEQEYLPTYSTPTSAFPWRANDALFAIWIGINDVGNSFNNHNTTLNDLIFNVYSAMVDKLYRSGGRNFLFLNVPATDRSPLITSQGSWTETALAADIADFNTRVESMASNLTKTYTDAKTWVFDSNRVFQQLLDNPCSHHQTCAIKNTTAYCEAYENGTLASNTYDAKCGIPVDEYFWLNSLHPTYRVQDVIAQEVAAKLEASLT